MRVFHSCGQRDDVTWPWELSRATAGFGATVANVATVLLLAKNEFSGSGGGHSVLFTENAVPRRHSACGAASHTSPSPCERESLVDKRHLFIAVVLAWRVCVRDTVFRVVTLWFQSWDRTLLYTLQVADVPRSLARSRVSSRLSFVF